MLIVARAASRAGFFCNTRPKNCVLIGGMRISRLLILAALGMTTLVVRPVFSQTTLQEMIDQAAEGTEVRISKGRHTDPIHIKKTLKLRGDDAADCIIEVTSDSPAILVEGKGAVELEGVTIRWKRETSNRKPYPQAGLVAKDSNVKLRNVRFIAPDDKMRCPSALMATGFSEIDVSGCEFEGFDFTIQVGEGARGTISDCVIVRPGHCGITVGNGGKLEVTGNIVTGSEFHAIRCTGGELIAKNNLIVANKNRGFYLGNKAARGEIKENAILRNGTGISGFGGSEVEIAHNYIADSDFAAIDMRDNCRLKIDRNTIVNNARGLVIFKEAGENKNSVLINALGGNKIETEGFEKAPDIERVSAGGDGYGDGRFMVENARGFGLSEPERIQTLWRRFQAFETRK